MDFLALLMLLVIDTSASWVRMFAALGLSILISVLVGIYAATHPRAEKLILPVVDILQTIPILAFFPFAILIFIAILPGYIGINAAVIFLIVTSMLWNIILAVYESIKTLPLEFIEISEIYRFDRWTRLKKIYFPACFPRIVEQSILSWSIGLFYLVTSEIFSTGNASYKVVYGIGVAFTALPALGVGAYLLGILVFIAFVVATRFLFFRPLENYAIRYTRTEPKITKRRYENILVGWISNRVQKTPAAILYKSVRDRTLRGGVESHIQRRRHIAASMEQTKNYWKIVYRIIFIAAVIGVVYIFLSNPTVLGYELQVLPALGASLVRIWVAFAVMLAITIPLCIYLTFRSRQSSKYMLLFQIIASIPATILLPAIAVVLSNYNFHGELVAFVIFVLSGIWYVVFSIIASTRTLPQSIFEVQKIFGVKGTNAWKNIYLKAILPGLITGAMTGIAAEWNASIVAEYFTTSGISGSNVISSVGTGLGKLLDLSLAQGPQGLGLMAVALLNLVVVILLINTFVWKRLYKQVSKIYGG